MSSLSLFSPLSPSGERNGERERRKRRTGKGWRGGRKGRGKGRGKASVMVGREADGGGLAESTGMVELGR